MGRVFGQLAVTRTVGDFEIKAQHSTTALQPNAEITQVKLNRSTDTFIVLACDGLFDIMKNEQVRVGNRIES